MPWKSGFFVSRSATHIRAGAGCASWLAKDRSRTNVCGGTPQRDGAERNRAAWQNGDRTERYGGTPQRDGAERNRAAWQNGNRTERYGAAPGTKNKAEEDESDENL